MIDDGVFEVLAPLVTHLSGGDLANCVIEQYRGTDVSTNVLAMGKLEREVEKAKRTLSGQQSTRIGIETFEDGNNLSETLPPAKFEELNIDLFRKTTKPAEQGLKDANVDIHEVSVSDGCPAFPSPSVFIRLFLLVVQHIFPRSNRCAKTTLARNLPRVSTLTKLSHTELLCREISSLGSKEQKMFLLISGCLSSVLRPLAVLL